MTFFIYISLILLIGTGLILWVSNQMFRQLIYSPPQAGGFLFYREAIQKRFDLAAFNHWNKEVFYIESKHNYHIHGTHIHAHTSSNKFIILCHGFSCQQLTSLKYVQLFLDRGFHVILYDQRYHGFSGGEFITYGYYEKDDLDTMVQFIYEKFGTDCQIGIHGESMGAVTALLYAGNSTNQADFYIADCAFSDFPTIIKERYKHNYPFLPIFPFFWISKWIWKKKLGFDWEAISPIHFMQNIQKPTLLIHTEKDCFTSIAHSERLHQIYPEGSTLVVLPEGGHAQAIVKNQEKYAQTVDEFLSKHHLQ